ncbi:MAG: L,D-transpeptidase family protein [Polyangiaceae bacterium]
MIRISLLAILAVVVGCESTPKSREAASQPAHTAPPTTASAVINEASASATALESASAAPTPATSTVASLATESTAKATPDVRMPTDWEADLSWGGTARVKHAIETKQAVVEQLFAKAGVPFPAVDLLFRIFKLERQFEVWAGDGKSEMKLIGTWGICAASGQLGPKRNEGDYQVPEGFYKVGYYYPSSSYYLAAEVDYPNASDKVRGGPKPGGEIMIHGNCVSVGCVAMTDERIEEIYVIGWSTGQKGRPTYIHIFPSRDLESLLSNAEYADMHEFWRELRPGFDVFEQTHRLPTISTEKDGRYVIKPAKGVAP